MEVEVREQDDALVVTIRGEIDLHSSGELRGALLDCISRRPPAAAVIVDMAQVSVIDSSGVASLLEALRNSRKKGKDFILARVSDPAMRVFRLARLEGVFAFAASVAAAVEARRKERPAPGSAPG